MKKYSGKKYSAPKTWRGMFDLYQGKEINEIQIGHSVAFIKERWDCADFRMVPLIRTMYQLKERLSDDAIQIIEDTILTFKYWLDEPGSVNHEIWYTTENHQILYHSSEYLAGQMYKDRIFKNSGMTGLEHQQKARKMIIRWLDDRFKHGMSEWYSPVYYEEDIPPICNLIDFAEDEEVVQKSKMVLDLLLLDLAMQNYKGSFSVSSGRCHLEPKKYPRLIDTSELIEYIWGFGNIEKEDFSYERLSTMFYMMENYEVPEVIKQIGKDNSELEIKTSVGLNLNELNKEIFSDKERDFDDSIRYLWAMNAFSNHEVFDKTMKAYSKYGMGKKGTITELKPFDNFVLRNLKLNGLISRILKPYSNGAVLQRSNVYTYKNKDYMMSTSQKYHPGMYGAQQHIWSATLDYKTVLFTTAPGSYDPNHKQYWVGNSRHPHSVQHKNINISIYKIPNKKAFLEKELPHFTHMYIPTDNFDELIIKENKLFGRLDNKLVSVIGKETLELNDNDNTEIIQRGQETYWITEVDVLENYKSFDDFIEQINRKHLSYSKNVLKYDNLSVEYNGDFKVDNKIINTNYKRYETPYITAERNSKKYTISFNKYNLTLDYENLMREFN